jgi:transposase
MEQVTYNMLFRWFVGLSMDAPVWDVTVFTKNRVSRDNLDERRIASSRNVPELRPGYLTRMLP